MRLQQGGMTVSEYAMRFEHLARFYLQAISEAWKCIKFAEGGNHVTRTFEGPTGSKRGGNQRKQYDRPQPQQGGPVIRKPSEAARGGRQGGGATLRCYRCVGPHFVKDCSHTESRCFKCHQMGHESTICPARNRLERDAQRGGAQRGDVQRGDRPTTTGRVFALTGAKASTSSNLVKGKGRAAGKDMMILFDSGASHSFISYACVAMLGVPLLVRLVGRLSSSVGSDIRFFSQVIQSSSSPLLVAQVCYSPFVQASPSFFSSRSSDLRTEVRKARSMAV
ncbi:uncharacterized protein LOC109816392 [Cajanus cajan]|uniref:uncharacterized protein LOC109816392 n=1 Tax=Cajanus cajan TaxID=3821 RepID=UPI00098D9C2F|nr:uncharacterized protein LOC109816392 [Cajanus cajan]